MPERMSERTHIRSPECQKACQRMPERMSMLGKMQGGLPKRLLDRRPIGPENTPTQCRKARSIERAETSIKIFLVKAERLSAYVAQRPCEDISEDALEFKAGQMSKQMPLRTSESATEHFQLCNR